MDIKDSEQGCAKGMNIKEVLRSRATPAPPRSSATLSPPWRRATPAPPRQLPGTTPHLPLPELCHPCTSLELLLLGSRLYSKECLSKLSTPPQTVDRETAGRQKQVLLFCGCAQCYLVTESCLAQNILGWTQGLLQRFVVIF